MCNSIGILSVLTASGLGISYLPYGYFTDKMIKQGRLQVLDTAPGFPPFEYRAVFDERNPQPLFRLLTAMPARRGSATFGLGNRPEPPTKVRYSDRWPENGAGEGIRTLDPHVGNVMLYP